ncbi:SDR family NAD(P)-dependent oxidoreductase [Microbacter margulisiae]|uniref:NAD(P)-dependent dehydrogenase (Short-subunit alcohol dehydrogenase family) n=1 Tax=Microbacter margulisiae TaxID=1350067 RepID=A0A7W5DP04_9PORP|nr:SDR family oxidoreductase [Microbacter margulisiae]MBB3185964.1 NAD(P)-dependent dehydrogenase (short-subunit alcohol dehydrogenase family) [Microbacter margulisiae]
MSNPFDLTGKNILITGASSGIGRQCAISCAKMGANVLLTGRNEGRLQETLSCMENKLRHLLIPLDLAQYADVTVAVEKMVEQKGRIDGVIHCAGISTTQPLKLVTVEMMETFFQTNVFAAYHLTKEVCKMGHFAKEGGSIVFLSSIMGSVGETGKSLYGMTKGALLAGVRSLACELAPKHIRVNAISPGAIVTPINENLPHMADPEKRAALEKQHLLGLGTTEDVANACIYLLSDASKWVTGTNLFVDGGYTAK